MKNRLNGVEYKNQQILKNIKYCIRCCMPETQEGIKFDEMGICQACQSSEQKIHIDWTNKEKNLKALLNKAKKEAGNNYDCIVPISGGKDSTFQLHVLIKVYHMKPLAVTFSHNWFSKAGWYNLQNALEQFNIDHIMFTPNRNLVNRLARKSLEAIGDACWHCHAGVGAFPLHIAVKFKIPLIVWGESIAESSSRASYYNPLFKFDRNYFTKVSAKLKPSEMICSYLSAKDLYPFKVPTIKEINDTGVFGIHLGDYIFWDDERQTEFIKQTYNWKETRIEGTYKHYKSAECIMPGVHDFANYLKRGYSRASFHASIDIRNGLLTRNEAFKLSNKYDPIQPKVLDYFLDITGMSKKEFYRIMKKHRHKNIKNLKLPIYYSNKKNKKVTKPYIKEFIESMSIK